MVKTLKRAVVSQEVDDDRDPTQTAEKFAILTDNHEWNRQARSVGTGQASSRLRLTGATEIRVRSDRLFEWWWI